MATYNTPLGDLCPVYCISTVTFIGYGIKIPANLKISSLVYVKYTMYMLGLIGDLEEHKPNIHDSTICVIFLTLI